MSRQNTGPLLPAASFRQHLVYQIPRHQAGQHTDPNPVGQPYTAGGCHLAALLFTRSSEDNG
jgi:hypothetical protein